jgi:hypothetical protein
LKQFVTRPLPLITGATFCWIPSAPNWDSYMTLNDEHILKWGSQKLVRYDIQKGELACVIWDGRAFQLQNPQR